tara:strand:- start:12254 stop:12883 length:630 start_codon:yes stop_codon:yes gene_type:complete
MEKNLADYRWDSSWKHDLSIYEMGSPGKKILNGGCHSRTIITIINNEKIVLKKDGAPGKGPCFNWELKALLQLNKSGITPELKYFDSKNHIIGLEYAGLAWNLVHPTPEIDYPDLARQYIEAHKNLFLKYDIILSDRAPKNLCFHNNKIKLIDFGHYKIVTQVLKERGKEWDKERLYNSQMKKWNAESRGWFCAKYFNHRKSSQMFNTL